MAALLYGHPDVLITLNSAVSSIPITYNSAAGSLIRQILNEHPKRTNFSILNYTVGTLAVSLDNINDHFVCPAGMGGQPSVLLIERIAVVQIIAIRSLTGSIISSGLVDLMVW